MVWWPVKDPFFLSNTDNLPTSDPGKQLFSATNLKILNILIWPSYTFCYYSSTRQDLNGLSKMSEIGICFNDILKESKTVNSFCFSKDKHSNVHINPDIYINF